MSQGGGRLVDGGAWMAVGIGMIRSPRAFLGGVAVLRSLGGREGWRSRQGRTDRHICRTGG